MMGFCVLWEFDERKVDEFVLWSISCQNFKLSHGQKILKKAPRKNAGRSSKNAFLFATYFSRMKNQISKIFNKIHDFNLDLLAFLGFMINP